MIEFNDYPLDTIPPGETMSFDHAPCGDIRRRLYLTRDAVDPNKVLGYCHNCQESGITNKKTHPFRVVSPTKGHVTKQSAFIEPELLEYDVDKWPSDATALYWKSKLLSDTCNLMGIAYYPTQHRIYLPVWDSVRKTRGTQLGYQLRRLGDYGPKYITSKKAKDTELHTLLHCNGDSLADIGVVVEDLISGLVIKQAMKNESCTILVNYGVQCRPSVLNKLNAKEYIVWLDNDNSTVNKQADTIASVLNLLHNKKVHIERKSKDPKRHTHEYIRDVLGRHLK